MAFGELLVPALGILFLPWLTIVYVRSPRGITP
jgi:hypothetical protein